MYDDLLSKVLETIQVNTYVAKCHISPGKTCRTVNI